MTYMPNRNQFHTKKQNEKTVHVTEVKEVKPSEEINKPKSSSYYPDKKMRHERMNIQK